MYKFNFLAKINKEKLEQKKRERLVKLVFFASTFCLVGLLVVLYFNSIQIGSNHKEAVKMNTELKAKIKKFRKNDFFDYTEIRNVYNQALERKKITSVLDVIESSADSTIIMTKFELKNTFLQLIFVAKLSGSRSQMMNLANQLKDKLNEKLKSMHYLDEKKPLRISRFPEIKSEVNNFQYWEFAIDVDLAKKVSKVPKEETNSQIISEEETG